MVVEDATETCEHACLDDFGKNRRAYALRQRVNGIASGCCEPVFRCSEDTDCASQGQRGQCSDSDMIADAMATGVCFDWFCAVDSDCEDGESCAAGKCEASQDVAALSVRFVSQPRVLTTGSEVTLLVEAYHPDNQDVQRQRCHLQFIRQRCCVGD